MGNLLSNVGNIIRQAFSPAARISSRYGLTNIVGGFGQTPKIHIVRGGEVAYEEMKVYAGISSLRHSPYHDNFTLETQEMRMTYRKWASEPTVKSALLGKTYSVASLGLQVTPSEKGNPKSAEIADCVRHCLHRPLCGFPGLVYEMVTPALMDGWSLCEPVWVTEDRGRFRGKRVMYDFKSKDTRYVIPRVDQYRNVIGYYNPRGNYNHLFDPGHFVSYTHIPLFKNPTGTSDLRAAYRSMQMIPAVLKLRMIFLDKYVGPFLQATIKDPALKAKMAFELAKARNDGFIILDPASDIKAIELASRGTVDFQAGLDDLRKEAATAISGAFLHMMTAADPNARGDSQVQQDTTDVFVWWLAEQIAAVIKNQLVPMIVDFNYGSLEDIPGISLEAVRPGDIVNDLAIDEALDRMSLPTSAEELLDRARRSPPKNDADNTQLLKKKYGGPAGGDGMGGPGQPQPQPSPFPTAFAEPPAGHSVFILPSSIGFPNLSPERFIEQAEEQAYDTFAEQTKFTGTRKDRLGRTICYREGRRVPCKDHPDDPKNLPIGHDPTTGKVNPELLRERLSEIVHGHGRAAALWEIDNVGAALKGMGGEALRSILRQATGAGRATMPDVYTGDPNKYKADEEAARQAIVKHLSLERKSWYKANRTAPTAAVAGQTDSAAVAIDYRQKNPDHPIAVAIRNDADGRKLVSDFLSTFGPQHELAGQFDKINEEFRAAAAKSQDASSEYTKALLAESRAMTRPETGLNQKQRHQKKQQLRAATDAAKAKADALKKATADLDDKLTKSHKAGSELAAKSRSWLVDNVKPAVPSKIEYDIAATDAENVFLKGVKEWVGLPQTGAEPESINAGHSFVESLAGGVKSKVIFAGTPTGRAFYLHNTNSIREAEGKPLVTIRPITTDSEYARRDAEETAVHELGHHIEHSIPGMAQKAGAFRDYRCGNEPLTQLNKLPGGEGYGDREVGRKDDFDRMTKGNSIHAYYVGKSYGAAPDSSTEVVSMGLEHLYRDPVGFAKADPEYFQWLLTSIRGAKQ